MNQKEFSERYRSLAHAMQTGVLHDQQGGSQDGSPKHLRVGVNNALRDHVSLVQLLIDKGLISESEYFEYIIRGLEQEVREYETRLSERFGYRVTLG